VIDRLVHEKDLIKRHPEEIAHIPLQSLLREMGEYPIEVELPPDNAGGDLVDEGFVDGEYGLVGKMAVYGLVQRPAVFNFPYYRDADGSDRAEVILYAPCPPTALSYLPWAGAC
jgi:hypothetical protein